MGSSQPHSMASAFKDLLRFYQLGRLNQYNSPDMADIHILASDQEWWWGQTTKDFMAHKLVATRI